MLSGQRGARTQQRAQADDYVGGAELGCGLCVLTACLHAHRSSLDLDRASLANE